MSRCIWALADEALTEKVSQNQEIDAKNWLFSMHDKLPEKDFVLLVVTLWAVWRARRKVIYEDIFQSPISTNQFIQSYLADHYALNQPRNKTV